MKMKIMLAALLMAGLLLAGCAGQDDPEPTTGAAATTAPAPTLVPTPTPQPTPTPTPAPTPTPQPTSTPTPAPTPTPQPTSTPTPAPTPTPQPTATPTPEPGVSLKLAWEATAKWIGENSDLIADLVAVAITEDEEIQEAVPALLRASLQGVLKVAVEDQLGNELALTLANIEHQGGTQFVVAFLVEGTVVVDAGPLNAVDVVAPIYGTIDLATGELTEQYVDTDNTVVTLRLQ